MPEISYTAIKSTDYDKVLQSANDYFNKHKLTLVMEQIGGRKGSIRLSPKSYPSLQDYQRLEVEPMYAEQLEFTTNFDFFVHLARNPNWCAFSYPTKAAQLTLNIDEQLCDYLSEVLDTVVFDYFEYTVVDQMLIRSYFDGTPKDKLFITGGGDIDIDVDEAEGYFEALKSYDGAELADEERDAYYTKLSGFFEHIGFVEESFDYGNENSRWPLYLKGDPNDIRTFLQSKQDEFYW